MAERARGETVAASGLEGMDAATARRGWVEASVPDAGERRGVFREHPGRPGRRTMLFWGYWKFHELHNVELSQGTPTWRPEGTYVDPQTGSAGSGRVLFDAWSGRWRQLYGKGEYYVAESEDGIHWSPASMPDVVPPGGKRASHHVESLPGEGETLGRVYHDPVAADGYAYKIAAIEKGWRAYERARANPSHRWHALTQRFDEPRHHMFDYLVYVSRDGLRWSAEPRYDWSSGRVFPEEPHFLFYNHLTGRHHLLCRPGLGDRRVAMTSTSDFVEWSEPRLVLAPERSDGRILEFYAMPTFSYGQYFVGLAWASEFGTSEGPDWTMLHKGPQYPQLVMSADGEHFTRPTGTPFIPLHAPGEIGGHSIRPEGLVVLEDEMRIYSIGGRSAHGTPLPEELAGQPKAMLMHTLRRDGFMYLQSRGYWGEATTRPFALFDGEVTVNAEAPTGELRFEVRDFRNRPVAGYTFEESEPVRFADGLALPLRWRERSSLAELAGKVIRLGVKLYNARLYSIRADYHFVDAFGRRRLRDGLPLMGASWFGG